MPLSVSYKSSLVLLGPFNPTGAKTVHQWPIQITSLGNSGGSDAGHGGGDGDGDDLADREGHASNLGDEDGGHGLVQRGAVHVDGGTDGELEPVVRKEDTNFKTAKALLGSLISYGRKTVKVDKKKSNRRTESDRPRDPRVDAVLLLQQVDGDRQRRRRRGRAEGRRESVRHVGDEPGIRK